MDNLVLPLIFLSPFYVPCLLILAAMALTSKERNHPAVLTNSEIFTQMKKSAQGFKLAATISLSALFLYNFVINFILFPTHNDGGAMANLVIFVFSIFLAAMGFSSFYFYNFLFLAETKSKAAAILIIPFSGLIVCVLAMFFLFCFLEFSIFLILSPFAIIYSIMLIVLIRKRTKFPDPFVLKISILKQK
jgi:hypothetical protein